MFRLLKPRLSISSINKRTFYEQRNVRLKEEEWIFSKIFRRLQIVKKVWKDEWDKHVRDIPNIAKITKEFSQPNQEDVVWKFDGTAKSLEQWIVNCDRDWHYGYSTANLELSSTGTGIFHGVLDTRVMKDGRTTTAGYCNITSIPKGDGRCYLINLSCSKYIDATWYDAHNYLMYTRGGPYWQVVRIPFSKFVYTKKAQLHELQHPVRN
ncbi:Complex I intermediate-associated protein 30, mitochondrial [Anthophora retusa]